MPKEMPEPSASQRTTAASSAAATIATASPGYGAARPFSASMRSSSLRTQRNSRLYIAPQATIRDTTLVPPLLVPPVAAGGITNRRRRQPSGQIATEGIGFSLERQSSNNELIRVVAADTNNNNDGGGGTTNDRRSLSPGPQRWRPHYASPVGPAQRRTVRMGNNNNTDEDRSESNNAMMDSSARGGGGGGGISHNNSLSNNGAFLTTDEKTPTLQQQQHAHANQHYGYTNARRIKKGATATTTTGSSSYPKLYCFKRQMLMWFTPFNVLQFVVLIFLGAMIYDSHHKVKHHRNKLVQYDEERSHILEQMRWMDGVSKKVHSNYQKQQLLSNVDVGLAFAVSSTSTAPSENVERLRQQLQQLQLRIQSNARDKIHEWFGDKPITMTLSFGNQDNNQVHLALSDDTPHAIGTLLQQQREKNLWQRLDVHKTGAVVTVRSLTSAEQEQPTTPVLEFVESSRKCHERGSVALVRRHGDSILSLQIYLRENAIAPGAQVEAEDRICIGKVASGMEFLDALL